MLTQKQIRSIVLKAQRKSNKRKTLRGKAKTFSKEIDRLEKKAKKENKNWRTKESKMFM